MLDFQIPRITSETVEENRGSFTIEPLDRGFGYTFGNSLRRVLLSSLAGAAVTSVRIEGVAHEFSTIKGVTEDVTDIVLNLKGIVCRMHSDATEVEAPLVVTGPGEITRQGHRPACRRRDPQPRCAHRHAREEDQARDVPDDRPRPRLPPGGGQQVPRPADRRHPDRLDLLAGAPRRLRASSRRASASAPTTTSSRSTSRPTARSTRRPRCARRPRSSSRSWRSSPTPTASRSCARARAASSRDPTAPVSGGAGGAGGASAGPMHDILIEELELGVRSYNCLKRAGIQTVGDLISKSEGELERDPELRQEVDRRGHRDAARPRAGPPRRLDSLAECATRRPAQAQPRRRAPQGAADQPLQGGHRARADQDHRGEGQGRQARGRAAHHAGQARRPARPAPGAERARARTSSPSTSCSRRSPRATRSAPAATRASSSSVRVAATRPRWSSSSSSEAQSTLAPTRWPHGNALPLTNEPWRRC